MRLGIDILLDDPGRWLGGGRVALLSHQAAVSPCGATTAERLQALLGDRLGALLGPEHGYFGTAGPGHATRDERHPRWNIPVHALYGEHRAPTPPMLADIDVLVVDFQDLGARCYTYLATLRRTLEAAARVGLRVVVADRPVPLPQTLDGPPLDPACRGFVADAAVPMAYGMTPGETARWLQRGIGGALDLRVAPCSGWVRAPRRDAGCAEWIPPSPAIRTWESAELYLATVFSEAFPDVDVGRQTPLAFRVLSTPWLDPWRLCDTLAGQVLEGVSLHPHRYVVPGSGGGSDELRDGVRLTVTDPLRFRPVATSVALLEGLGRQAGRERLWAQEGARPGFFDQLYGSTRTREALQAGVDWRRICADWESDLEAFRASRRDVLLYDVAAEGGC